MRNFFAATLLLLAFAPLAHARDFVGFGRTETISSADQANDIVCAFCTLRIEGPVQGDVVTAFSTIQFGSESNISGDTVTAFTHLHFTGDHKIQGDMVSFGSNVDTEGSLTVNGDRVGVPGFVAWLIIIAPFAFIAFVVWLITRLVQRRRYAYPPPGYPGPYIPRP